MSSLTLLESIILAASTAVAGGLTGFLSATLLERVKKPYLHDLAKVSTRMKALDDQQIRREYELYETVYAQVYETYQAFTRARAMDEPIGALEEADLRVMRALFPEDASQPNDVLEARKRVLQEAFDKLRENIHLKRPFLPGGIFVALEEFWVTVHEAYFSRSYPELYKPPMKGPTVPCTNEDIKKKMDAISEKISERLDVERHVAG